LESIAYQKPGRTCSKSQAITGKPAACRMTDINKDEAKLAVLALFVKKIMLKLNDIDIRENNAT
jgi:hypothetical protein